MGEENKATEMVAYIDGQPVGAIQGIPEMSTLEEPESQAGNLETLKAVAAAKFEGAISAEQLEEAVETIRAAFAALAATFERVAEVMRDAVSAIAWGYELQRAIQWAEIYNPRLVHFYRHTKKGRIRKKYAKRIMAWYFEEVPR